MHQQGYTKVQETKCRFFAEKKREILGASPDLPDGLITDPSKSNLHEIIEAKNVIVMDDETLKDSLIKSICKMLDTGLKVNKSHMHFSL